MEKNKIPSNSTLTDEEIIDLYFERDERAIEQTDAKYGALIYKIAYNILSDNGECEECKNDTYLGVWNRIPPTRPSALSAFISRIARNVAIDRYKEKSAKKRVPSEMTSSIDELSELLRSSESPEESLEAKELGEIISDYLRTLTRQTRYIFISRFYIGDSIETIARELSISTSAVYKSLKNTKAGLKTYLTKRKVII